jgi:hypothetical protein
MEPNALLTMTKSGNGWRHEEGNLYPLKGPSAEGKAAGLLRIDFPSGSDPPLEPISWDAFFKKFDEAGLEMIYQDQKESGGKSYFCKFVNRETAASSR